MINPNVSYLVWVIYCDVHPCFVIKRTAGVAHYLSGWAHLHLPCRTFTSYARNRTRSLDCPGYFPPRGGVWLHSSLLLGHVWAWVTENICWSSSVECGSKRARCLFMYISAQVLSAYPTTCWLISRPISKWPLRTWVKIWLTVDKRKSKCVERMP